MLLVYYVSRRIQFIYRNTTYLQFKELAVPPVDDMGSGVGVSDVDEVNLVREAQTKEAH